MSSDGTGDLRVKCLCPQCLRGCPVEFTLTEVALTVDMKMIDMIDTDMSVRVRFQRGLSGLDVDVRPGPDHAPFRINALFTSGKYVWGFPDLRVQGNEWVSFPDRNGHHYATRQQT